MLRHYKALSLCAAVLATAAGVAVAVAPANAQSRSVVITAPIEAPIRLVSFRDLDLDASRDRKTLMRRVDHAVGEVCADLDIKLAEGEQDVACRNLAWRNARPQIARAISGGRKLAMNGNVTSLAAAGIDVTQPAI